MVYIKNCNIVNIPPVSLNVPLNLLLSYYGSKTAPPSTATLESGLSHHTLAHRVLLYHKHCLVTGAVSNQLHACYLISPICAGRFN